MMIIDAADERATRPAPPTQTSSSSMTSSASTSAPPVPEKPAKIISEEDYEPVGLRPCPAVEDHADDAGKSQ